MFAKIINAIKSFFANERAAVKAAKEERKTKKIFEMSKENKKVYLTYLAVVFLTTAILSAFVTYFFMMQVMAIAIGGQFLKPFIILCLMGFVIGVSVAALEEQMEKSKAD
jgi:hypothetical protein